MATININQWINGCKFIRLHWILFLFYVVRIAFDGYSLTAYGPTVPPLMRDGRLTPTQAGIICSCAQLGAAFGAIGFGIIVDKLGRKATVLSFMVLFAVATRLTGLANHSGLFGVWRFIAGLRLGGVLPNLVAVITEYSSTLLRTFMVAAVFSGFQIRVPLQHCTVCHLGLALRLHYRFPAAGTGAAMRLELPRFAVFLLRQESL